MSTDPLRKLAQDLDQWSSRNSRSAPVSRPLPAEGFTARSRVLPQDPSANAASTSASQVSALRDGLQNWMTRWQATSAALGSSIRDLENSRVIVHPSERHQLGSYGDDGSSERIADVQAALAAVPTGNDLVGEHSTALERLALNNKNVGSTENQLLLRDIAETGRVAEVELKYKKEMTELAHKFHTEIADLKADAELARQSEELHKAEAERHREDVAAQQEKLTLQGFELKRATSRAATLELELEEQERAAAERLERAKSELQAERDRARAREEEDNADRVNVEEHRRLQSTCASLDAKIASFKAFMDDSQAQLAEVAAQNRELEGDKERLAVERDEARQQITTRAAERDFFEQKYKESVEEASKLRLDLSLAQTRLEVGLCFVFVVRKLVRESERVMICVRCREWRHSWSAIMKKWLSCFRRLVRRKQIALTTWTLKHSSSLPKTWRA